MQGMEIARSGNHKENATFLQGMENARKEKTGKYKELNCKEWKMHGTENASKYGWQLPSFIMRHR